ncbi:MAG: hypothetical protein MHPSP_004195, partial [Paramarteilia canceri]
HNWFMNRLIKICAIHNQRNAYVKCLKYFSLPNTNLLPSRGLYDSLIILAQSKNNLKALIKFLSENNYVFTSEQVLKLLQDNSTGIECKAILLKYLINTNFPLNGHLKDFLASKVLNENRYSKALLEMKNYSIGDFEKILNSPESLLRIS